MNAWRNEGEIAAFCASLAHQSRLQIMRLLQDSQNGVSAGEIARHLALSPSRLSFHLSRLEAVGLITSTRKSRQIIYSASPAHLKRLASIIDQMSERPSVEAQPIESEAIESEAWRFQNGAALR